MSCKIEYIVAPNGEMSTLYGQLVDITGDQDRAAKIYLDAMDLNVENTNEQGDPRLSDLIDAGLLQSHEITRSQQGPAGYNQMPVEDSVIQDVIFQIDNAIDSIEKQLNQSLSKGEQENLRDQIRELRKDKKKLEADTLSSVRRVAQRHMKWAKTLLNDTDASSRDILHAIRLMDFWDTDVTFQFLNKSQREDDEDKYNKTFSDIGKDAVNKRVDLVEFALERIADQINEESDEEITVEELKDLHEISWSKEQVFNISHVEQPLIQFLDEVNKEAYNASTSVMKDMNQQFKEFEKDVDPSVILRKDENGNPVDEFIGPFSQDYLRKRAEAKRKYEGTKKKASGDLGDVMLKAKKNLYKRLNDIEILLDPNNLDNEKQRLVDEGVPESIADYAVEEAKNGLEKFKRARREYKDTIQAELDSGLWQEKSLEDESQAEYEQRKIRQFDKNNSPYLYYKDRQKDNPEFAFNSGFKYTYSVPKTGEGYYDEAFSNLSERELEFWKTVTGWLSSARSFLPQPVSQGLDERFLPYIQKSMVEQFKHNGAKYAIKYGFQDFMDNIRSVEEKTLEDTEEDQLNVFRGPADRDQVPIRFIGDPDIPKNSIAESIDYIEGKLDKLEKRKTSNSISDEEYNKQKEELTNKLETLNKKKKNQSLDVVKATQMFVSMALRYKNMTDVSAQGELIHRIIDEANTVNPNGGISNLGRLKNAVKEEINYLVYGVSRKQDEMMSNIFDNVTDNPFKSPFSRRRRKEIENMRDELDKQLEDGEITQEEWDEKMEPLKKEYKELGGRNLVWSKVIDYTLLPYAQLKGMGLNIGAAFRNVGYGIIMNFIHAAGQEEFTDSDAMSAFWIMLNSMSPNNTKVRSLVDKFGILFEVIDIEYGNDRSFDAFDPYFLQSKTEFFGQGMTLVATMLNTTVTDAEGNERSLWSAFDNNGDWKTEEFGENSEWRTAKATKDLLDEDGSELVKFKNKIIQLNNRLHGDYAKSSKQLIKKSVWGRLISMFRTWIPEAIAYRFGETRNDKHLGRNVTGSYRAVARSFRDNNLGDNISFITKAFIPFMDSNMEEGKISKEQQADMRRAIREMQIYSVLAMIVLALKGGIDDDEEMNATRKVLINNLSMLQQDIGLYVDPSGYIDLAENPVPAVNIYMDYENLMRSTYDYLSDEDYQGDHPIWKFAKATPVLKQMNTVKWQSERVIED